MAQKVHDYRKPGKMNFLSHYYFERYSHDPELVIGSILPDLMKNANKDINIHPYRYAEKFDSHPKLASIYKGWTRHIETDRIFHNSPFFYDKTHELKVLLSPAIDGTVIRPSFLSHIALELLLDHLLLYNNWVHESDFYEYLAAVDRDAVDKFLKMCDINETGFFFRFFNSFMRSQYIGSYRRFDEIAVALVNICRRLWEVRLSIQQMQQLTSALANSAKDLDGNFKSIFDEVRAQLP